MTHQLEQLAVMFAHLGETAIRLHNHCSVVTVTQQQISAEIAEEPDTPKDQTIPLSLPELV